MDPILFAAFAYSILVTLVAAYLWASREIVRDDLADMTEARDSAVEDRDKAELENRAFRRAESYRVLQRNQALRKAQEANRARYAAKASNGSTAHV